MGILETLAPNIRNFAQELYEENKRTVWLIANKILHNPTLAEEVTHEVFIKLFAKSDFLRGLETEKRKAYIFTAAKYTAYTFYRKEKKYEHIDITEMDWLIADEEGNPDMIVLQKEAYEVAKGLIALLKPSYRDIVIMRINGDMSFREIGEALNITEGNARIRFHRALDQLKSEIRFEWRDCVE